MSMKSLFETLEYGPAPESATAALDWIRAHDGAFQLCIDGAWATAADGASFEVMERLMACGFAPDIISTDLHRASAESPVGSLADCMSKLLGLGMSEEAVVRAVTATPVAALHLGPATRRTRFVIEAEDWSALDSYGGQRTFARRFKPLGMVEG